MPDHVNTLTAILNSTQEGIVSFDRNNRCTFANKACCVILGCGNENEIQGRSVDEIFRLVGDKTIRNVISECQHHDQPSPDNQLTVQKINGELIPIDIRCISMAEDGKSDGYVITFFDITEKLRSEIDVKAKTGAIEATSIAIIFATLDGNITYVNKAFLELWEYESPDEVLGKPVSILAGVEGEADMVANAIMEHGHWVGEATPSKKNGEIFRAKISANMITDDKGSPLFLMSSVTDITEIKNVQTALERSEETYSKAEEIAHIGSWDWNILTGELRWTDEIYRIFGHTPQSFGATYEAFLESIHEDDRQKVIDAVNASVADENVEYLVEHRVVRANTGDIRIVQERGKVYRNGEGEPVQMIGTVYDVTEQRDAEKELDAYREKLEELVDARTRQLRQAQDDLVKSERLATLGQLTATVSHELRNPLGAMRPSVYVLRKRLQQEDEKVEQALARIDRNIDRCDRIIDELLDFTRITNLDIQETDLSRWLDGVIDEIEFPAGVNIVKTFGKEPLLANIDRGRFRRAIINVVENAYQATQEKIDNEHPSIEIGIMQENNKVKIVVKDNGVGISEEVKSKMFEPLFSTKGFGVGLGMPTVSQIVKQHHGGIEVNSIQGEGTEIVLWIPEK